MDAEARMMRNFVNQTLHSAHEEVKAIIPDFYDFKKKLKQNIEGIYLTTDETGQKIMVIALDKERKTKIEVRGINIINGMAKNQLRNIALSIIKDMI